MIDAHHHFWRTARADYVWLDASQGVLYRDYGPVDLEPLLQAAGVDRTILVQAAETVAETRFLLDLAEGYERVAGVVGWVDLAAPDAPEMIDALARNPRLKGLRPMLQSIEETGWILREEVQPALARMTRRGLSFDALIQPRHLPVLLELAQRHPDLPIVIDHIAKPRMGPGVAPERGWRDGMAALAARPNLFCKFSGMITEIGPDWQPEHLRPFARIVLDLFGPERVMWGSDWPVALLAGEYADWLAAARELTADLSAAEAAMVYDGTARAFYRIG